MPIGVCIMEKKTQSPLAGDPRTVEDMDENGQPRITVWLTALTPKRVKFADWMAMACAAFTVCAIPYGLFKIHQALDWQVQQPQLWLFGGRWLHRLSPILA